MREELSPVAYLDSACASRGGELCLVDGVSGHALTYEEVADRSRQIAATFRALPHLQTVGILAPNDVDAFIAQLGVYRAGLTVVPGNPRYVMADNAAIFSRFGAQLVFVHPALGQGIDILAGALPDEVTIVSLGAALGKRAIAWEDWLIEDRWEGPGIRDPQRPYAIQPTGGTTGEPKGVLLPVRELAFAVDSLLDLAPSDNVPVFLAAVPLTHAAGKFMHYTFAQGGCGVVLPGADAEGVFAAMRAWNVTHTFLPPTVIYDLLDSGLVAPGSLPTLEYVFYGAAPMSPTRLAQAIATFGPVMAQVYGQTESGLPNLYLSPRDHLTADGSPAGGTRLSCTGRVNPRCELELQDGSGEVVSLGDIGEIAIRCDGVMLGYSGDEDATAATRRNGWHLTGDMARIDEDGFVHIVDRAKDMIVSGGFNIYPAEVERVVNSHPAISDCAVLGLPDKRWGEAVAAVVEVKDGACLDADELIALCKQTLGSMKAPKQVIVLKKLPRSPVGKILKREVRQQFWQQEERQV